MPLFLLSNVILLSLFMLEHIKRRSRTSPDLCLFDFPVGQKLRSKNILRRFPGRGVERIALPLKQVSPHAVFENLLGEDLLDVVFGFGVAWLGRSDGDGVFV
jgi:hypothetical protein